MAKVRNQPAEPSPAKPIKAAEVKKLESVDANKFYKVTFQLGPKRSFGRAFPSGRWKENKSPLGAESTFDPVYAVYDQILDGKNTNGLIQENNDWQASNLRQKIEGEINRMLVIVDIKEAKDYVPPDMTFINGDMSINVMKMLVDAAVAAQLKSSK